jgi:N6-L-threonylcarbamoyladenine synthase
VTADSIYLLSIETTCDETGAAVLVGRPSNSEVPRIASSVVASQFELHRQFGGVVPEIAARAHLTTLLPVIEEALQRASIHFNDLSAVAVASQPGLVGSLLVGLTAAKALALVLKVPLVAFDHLEGHLYACQLAFPEQCVYPCVGLVVSGGHTHLYRCTSPIESTLLGGTTDDAAGEAFDKVASLLGLGFPGGPAVEQAALQGNPRAFPFPRAFLRDPRLDFSFSGLKTAVLYKLRANEQRKEAGRWPAQLVADIAASFQRAVVDSLVSKAAQALAQTGYKNLCVGGGVAANGSLRAALQSLNKSLRVNVFVPPLALCTDNASLGAIAFAKLAAGQVSQLDIDVHAGLVRPERRK